VDASRAELPSTTVAFSPSSGVWAAGKNGATWTSRWTRDEEPVPWMPFLPDWQPDDDPPSCVALYRGSPVAAGNATDHAAIRVAADRYPEAVRAADQAFDLLRDGGWGFRWSVLRFSGWSG
jgi:hypothetical protein